MIRIILPSHNISTYSKTFMCEIFIVACLVAYLVNMRLSAFLNHVALQQENRELFIVPSISLMAISVIINKDSNSFSSF